MKTKAIFAYSYHATAPLEEALRLARQKIPSAAALQLHSLSFDYFGLSHDETLLVSSSPVPILKAVCLIFTYIFYYFLGFSSVITFLGLLAALKESCSPTS